MEEEKKGIRMDTAEVRVEAENYAKKNLVKFERKEGQSFKDLVLSLRRRCVDGRHSAEQAKDSFAFAGADVGIVMALVRAGEGKIDSISAYKAVSKAMCNLNTSFFYHTDEHAKHDEHNHKKGETCFGCGHGLKATMADYGLRYGINIEEQKKLIEEIKSGRLEEGMAALDEVVLAGDHGEKGVLVIDSENLSVLPMDMDTKEQYFIYDARLIKQFMEIVWEQLVIDGNIDLSAVSKDEFLKSEGIQRDATVDILATSKDKPTVVLTEVNGELKAA